MDLALRVDIAVDLDHENAPGSENRVAARDPGPDQKSQNRKRVVVERWRKNVENDFYQRKLANTVFSVF